MSEEVSSASVSSQRDRSRTQSSLDWLVDAPCQNICVHQPTCQRQPYDQITCHVQPEISAFYSFFWPSHPFLPPLTQLSEHLRLVEYTDLFHVVNYIGSLYSTADGSNLFVVPPFQSSQQYPSNGFSVQSLMLLAIVFYMSGDSIRADRSLNKAADIALDIGLHRSEFALLNGGGVPSIEESWRRTWWELYVLDAMFAALNQTSNMRLKDVELDVSLPNDDRVYRANQVSLREIVKARSTHMDSMHPPRSL